MAILSAELWERYLRSHPDIARRYGPWSCGMPHCGADDMTLIELREHMAMTHDRPIRKSPGALATR